MAYDQTDESADVVATASSTIHNAAGDFIVSSDESVTTVPAPFAITTDQADYAPGSTATFTQRAAPSAEP